MSARRRAFVASVATAALTWTLVGPVAQATAQDGTDPGAARAAARSGQHDSARTAPKDAPRSAPRAPAGRQALDGYGDGVISRTGTFTEFNSAYNGGSDGRRFSRVVVTQNLASQRLSFTASLRAVPTQDAAVSTHFGTWDGDTCRGTAVLAATTVSNQAAAQVGSRELGATRTRTGAVVSATSAPLAAIRSAGYECAFVRLTAVTSATTVHQMSYAQDLTEQYRPMLRIDSDDHSMIGAARGRWASLDVEVRNIGEPTVRNVTVRVRGKGVQVKRATRGMGSIESGDDKDTTYKVRVKVPRKGKVKPRKVTVVATGSGVTTRRTFKVVVTPRPTTPKSLAGRYYWAFEPSSISDYNGWTTHTLWFVNSKYAFVGDVKGAKPSCRRASKTCLRYRYNARTGRATIGKRKATVRSTGFSWRTPAYSGGALHWQPLALPRKGSRLGLDLYRQDWTGYCMMTCTTWTAYLTMDKKGRFVTSSSSIGSWPGLGTYWSSVSPDDRGTYRVLKPGIVRLSYANGKTQRKVIGVGLNPLGKPDPEFGVLMNSTNYY